MADLELGTVGNSAKSTTALVAVPDPDLGGDRSFRGASILEVKCGTTLLTVERRKVTGIFASGSRSGIGVFGYGINNAGVVGKADNSTGVVGEGGTGVHGHSQQLGYSGVYGQHLGSGFGVVGDGAGSERAGVLGRNSTPGGAGVKGEAAPESTGVLGTCSPNQAGFAVRGDGREQGTGVIGRSGSWIGVVGSSTTGVGVSAQSSGPEGAAVVGFGNSGAKAGIFQGAVEVRGNLTVENGNKPFKIDHPLDPQNKYLLHNAVEAPERKNVYDGVAQLDEDGTVWVDLPKWFEALNGDFRYQLTAVGGPAPNLHVAEEVYENRFKIAGGDGGMKVCWQVTGTRKDPWAAANPFEVEEEKPQEERGRYLQPDLYDAPEEQSIMRAHMGVTREPPQPPPIPQPTGFEPPTAPAMALGFEPPEAPEMPPSYVFDMQAEHRQQMDELRGQIEELRRGRVEEEIDELRQQIKKLRRRRKR